MTYVRVPNLAKFKYVYRHKYTDGKKSSATCWRGRERRLRFPVAFTEGHRERCACIQLTRDIHLYIHHSRGNTHNSVRWEARRPPPRLTSSSVRTPRERVATWTSSATRTYCDEKMLISISTITDGWGGGRADCALYGHINPLKNRRW